MDFDYCQGNSTIILSFEREAGKWSDWKELPGICEFGETDYVPSGTCEKMQICGFSRIGAHEFLF